MSVDLSAGVRPPLPGMKKNRLKKHSRFSYLQEINDDLLMQKKNAYLLSLHVTFEYPMREKFDSVQIG